MVLLLSLYLFSIDTINQMSCKVQLEYLNHLYVVQCSLSSWLFPSIIPTVRIFLSVVPVFLEILDALSHEQPPGPKLLHSCCDSSSSCSFSSCSFSSCSFSCCSFSGGSFW